MAASALSSAGVSSLFSVGRTSLFPLNTAAISSSRGVRGCQHKFGGLLNRKSVYVEKGLRHKVGGLLNRKSVYIVKRLRHKVGGLLNRKSVYVVMTTDTEGFTASRFYSLSLTFSCLNFPVVFSRWTSDFWRGNCSCSACIKNTSVQEYNLDYMVQELYVVFSNSNWQWRYVHKMCSTLYSILFKFF